MIDIVKVGKYYRECDSEQWIVRELNLHIKKNSFISIVGRSGSGKSTLLKMIGGLLPPDEGKVSFEGIDVYSMPSKQIAQFRSNEIGFVFQDFLLEDDYTVHQNVEMALMISGIPRNKRQRMIDDVLQHVGLENRKKAIVKNLSGGERQRVCIARAIVNNPKIILADEPCGNLDYHNGQQIMNLLLKLKENGKTVLLVTHNLEDAKVADEIVTLQDGMITNHEIIR